MKIISLGASKAGYACGITDYLNKYNFKKERGFFDYLTSSIQNIIDVINNRDIEFESCEISKFIIPNPTNNIFVKFKNFDNMISYHDFVDLTSESLNYWAFFYKIIQQRLINIIKTEDKIVFVRFCVNQHDFVENDINEFFNTLHFINPNLKYHLIIVSIDFLKIPDSLANNPRFNYLNFRLYNCIYNKYTFNVYYDMVNYYDFKCFKNIIEKIELLNI